MKLGISSYSLFQAMCNEGMSILDIIQWAADHGAEHVEIVPFGFNLGENPALLEAIRKKADEAGIELSHYLISANFIVENDEQFVRELERVKREVDIARTLGVKSMRHDVASVPKEEINPSRFERDLPKLAEACREIADYAAQYGMVTSLENHGQYLQRSEWVYRLVQEVGRDNFRTTLDIGNFLCVDEDPVQGVRRNIGIASFIHLKDFHYRTEDPQEEGWFRTLHGNYLRGAVFGEGDVPTEKILDMIKQSGYNGYLSLEFEGREDCREACKTGLARIRKLLH